MKTKPIVTFTLLLSALISPFCLADMKEGPCSLKESQFGEEDAFKVEVGDKVKGRCEFYISDFIGQKIISASIFVTNTTAATMCCRYYAAFFDKEGRLIGCISQGSDGLEPGKETQFGSCIIPLPLGQHEKISSYKVTLYESDKPIGKK